MGNIATTIAGGKGAGEGDVSHYRHSAESERRRRAAWLLGALILVAALFVTLMVLFLNSGGNGQPAPKGIKPLPTAPPSTAHGQHSAGPTGTSHTSAANPPTRANRPQPSTRAVTEPPRVAHHRVSCPGEAPCIAPGDIGNAVAAINAYRVQHGVPAVNGAVTRAAQTCAVTNGGQCTGNWAESQVPGASGVAAIHKVAGFTNLLDRNLVSLQVGWAYDPGAQEYYFAVIGNNS